jgi:hypothetical protein
VKDTVLKLFVDVERSNSAREREQARPNSARLQMELEFTKMEMVFTKKDIATVLELTKINVMLDAALRELRSHTPRSMISTPPFVWLRNHININLRRKVS